MTGNRNFTRGEILIPLVRFALPVLFALFLQTMYGAADLLIVGKFAEPADVSAVATGAQIMFSLTNLMSSLAMGVTILLGQQIGQGMRAEGGRTVGSSVALFGLLGAVTAALTAVFAPQLAGLMQAPPEAFAGTAGYVRICGAGMLVIVAYNLLGSVFRGMGDSQTPLVTVAIACVCNIAGDLLLVGVFHMGASGAAVATVVSQALSVLLSCALIRRRGLPFEFHWSDVRLEWRNIRKVMSLGLPIAFQDLLVSASFLVILAIVNSLGLVASAGVGVAEKVSGFIMLLPLAFMQATSAFVAQNFGAGRMDRAERSMWYAIAVSFVLGVGMAWLSFFHGAWLAGLFAGEEVIVAAAADYLKAFSIDCMLTAISFCIGGFFTGIGMTTFVMIQGIAGAVVVRVPVAWIMSRWEPVSLFHIALAVPISSVVQVVLCLGALWVVKHRRQTRDLL